MLTLRERFSTAQQLLSLEPKELAAHVLDIAKMNAEEDGTVTFKSLMRVDRAAHLPDLPLYDGKDQPDIELAVREAVEELRLARLVVPSDNPGHSFLISRRGRRWQRGDPISCP